MRSLLVLVTAGLAMVGPFPASAAEGEPVDVAEVVGDPAAWDGHTVTVVGELVGDYSPRPEGVWVQVNDDAFVGSPVGAGGAPESTNIGVGALIPADLFRRVEGEPGRYGRIGPVVRLHGTFRHADPDLQGETYLDVEAVETVAPATPYPLPRPDFWLPVGATLVLASSLYAFRELRSRRESGPEGPE